MSFEISPPPTPPSYDEEQEADVLPSGNLGGLNSPPFPMSRRDRSTSLFGMNMMGPPSTSPRLGGLMGGMRHTMSILGSPRGRRERGASMKLSSGEPPPLSLNRTGSTLGALGGHLKSPRGVGPGAAPHPPGLRRQRMGSFLTGMNQDFANTRFGELLRRRSIWDDNKEDTKKSFLSSRKKSLDFLVQQSQNEEMDLFAFIFAVVGKSTGGRLICAQVTVLQWA